MLLLEILVLGIKTPPGFPQTLLLQAFAKRHTSTSSGIQRHPRKIFSQGPLCTNLVMISCKHPLGIIPNVRTSHPRCHCHDTKALRLKIHVLGTQTSPGPRQSLPLHTYKKKHGAASRDPCPYNQGFTWASTTSSRRRHQKKECASSPSKMQKDPHKFFSQGPL